MEDNKGGRGVSSLKRGLELWGIYGGVLGLLFFWFSKLGVTGRDRLGWDLDHHGGLVGLTGHSKLMGAL